MGEKTFALHVSVPVQNENFTEKTSADCSGPIIIFYVGAATKFCGENFRGLLRSNYYILCGCGHKILWRKLSRIAPVQLLYFMWVRPQNFVEKTFADCSGPIIIFYVGAATKFCGENFRGLLRSNYYILCGCGHKILWRKLSRMVLKFQTAKKNRKSFPLYST